MEHTLIKTNDQNTKKKRNWSALSSGAFSIVTTGKITLKLF